MRQLIHLTLICIWIFTPSCANIVPLGGGPEDTTPPALSKIERKPDRLILVFNENINLANAGDIVSNIYPTPQFEVKRNKLFISGIPDSEKKQLIYFNNSIQDLNANNPLQEYIYANNVRGDTFHFSGKLEIAFKPEEAIKGCYVLLTDRNVEIKAVEDLYNYEFTKTNEKGEYNFGFVQNPKGQHIFAFIDRNNNSIPDTGDYIGISAPITKDSSELTYLNYIGNNLVYADTSETGMIKSVYQSINKAVINRGNLLNCKVTSDSLFDFKNYNDSTILSKTGPILEGEQISIVSKDKYFPQASLNDTFLSFDFNLKRDSHYALLDSREDTIAVLNIVPKSTGSSILITGMSDLHKGLLINAQNYYFINKNTKPVITLSGRFTLFLYIDSNNNGQYDPISPNSFNPGERIIYNMKDIDIGPKMDVEISAKP